jgi:hypothetical protein
MGADKDVHEPTLRVETEKQGIAAVNPAAMAVRTPYVVQLFDNLRTLLDPRAELGLAPPAGHIKHLPDQITNLAQRAIHHPTNL